MPVLLKMQEYLSRYKISARICFGYAVLGCLLVVAGFVGYFSFNSVHQSYMKANEQVESIRRLAVLENDLSHVNAAFILYINRGREEDAHDVLQAFEVLKENLKTFLPRLTGTEALSVAEKLQTAVNDYQGKAEEVFSLSEKSFSLSDKARRQGETATERLKVMIADSTLPSATFALTNLQEQLESLIAASLKDGGNPTQYAANIQNEIDALQQALDAVGSAEMVNAKQLKGVTSAVKELKSELQKQLKTIETVEKVKKTALDEMSKNARLVKELTEMLSVSSAQVLYQAEGHKLLWQKGFIFFVAFSGFVTLVVIFLSLWGVRYPLNRLIEDIWEFTHGEPKSEIPFTQRGDEIGALAQALSALLEAWKNPLTFSASAKNYMPLGMPDEDGEIQSDEAEGFVVLGDADADAETQLRQMLMFFQHLQNSAAEMSSQVNGNFDLCVEFTAQMKEKVGDLIQIVNEVTQEPQSETAASFVNRLETLAKSFEKASEFLMKFAGAQEKSCDTMLIFIEQMKTFATGLFQWIRGTVEVSNSVHKTALQTKILALNASIEALKLGTKAKTCNDIISELRQLSQQTAQSVAHMQENMGALQEETHAFARVLESASKELMMMKSSLPQLTQTCSDAHQDSYELSEKSIPQAAKFQETFTRLETLAQQVAQATQILETALPEMEQNVSAARDSLNVFVQMLPTTEDPA